MINQNLQEIPSLHSFKPIHSSHHSQIRYQSPKIRQLAQSKTQKGSISNKSNLTISTPPQVTLNTAASETDLLKPTQQQKQLSSLLKKEVFRPASSLNLLSRKKERPRPTFSMFKEPPRTNNETISIRNLVSDKLSPTRYTMGTQNARSFVKESSNRALSNTNAIKRMDSEMNSRSKSAEKSSFTSILQSLGHIHQSAPKPNQSSTDISEILYSQPTRPKTPSRESATPIRHISFGRTHLAPSYTSKRKEKSTEIRTIPSLETSGEMSTKSKSKTGFEQLKRRILEDLDENHGGNRVQTEGSQEVSTVPKVGNIKLSLLVDKETMKRVKSAGSLKPKKPSTMPDVDAELSEKGKKPAAKMVKVKSWIEKLPKFTNLLKPPTSDNVLKELNSTEEESNSPGTMTSKNYRLVPWDELFKPIDHHEVRDFKEKENIQRAVDAKAQMWKKLRKQQRPKTRDAKQIKKSIMEVLDLIKSLNLTIKEVLEKKIFPKVPYEKNGSKEFIQAVKLDDVQKVKEMLILDPYLVYQYDHIYQTPLHWACKRAFKEIAEILIRAKSNLNAQDMVGRTPLFYAITNNNLELVKLLLYNKCDPWSNGKINYTSLVKKKPYIRYYLSQARKTHIVMKMVPPSKRNAIWDRQSYFLEQSPKRLPKFDEDEDSDCN